MRNRPPITLAAALERIEETQTKLRLSAKQYLRTHLLKPWTLHSFKKACSNVTEYEIRSLYGTWKSFVDQEIRPAWIRERGRARQRHIQALIERDE